MTNNQTYTRDMPERKPSVNHSYFYMPPAWIGEAPTDIELAGSPHNLVKVICSRQLSMGIRIDAHRDGVFLFDFTGWPDGRPVSIPAHTIVGGQRLPEPVLKARLEAEEHRYKSISVMNAHLACMSSALTRVQGLGVAIKQIITPSSYFTTHWENGCRWLVGIDSSSEPILAYVAANSRLDADIQKTRTRGILIRRETIDFSFDLLEKILVTSVPDTQLMTNLIYLAAINYSDHDFPTALTLSWTVCEKLLRILWNNYIENKAIEAGDHKNESKVISKERRKILQGRDFTASIISEALALAGLLEHEMYLALTKVRRQRNAWLHGLEPISGIAAVECIKTAQRFLKEVSGIELAVHLSYGARL